MIKNTDYSSGPFYIFLPESSWHQVTEWSSLALAGRSFMGTLAWKSQGWPHRPLWCLKFRSKTDMKPSSFFPMKSSFLVVIKVIPILRNARGTSWFTWLICEEPLKGDVLLHPKLTGQILDRFMNATCISRWELTTVTISIYRKFLNNVYVYVCVYVYVYCILYMYIVHICIHAYNCLMLFDYGSETLVPLKQLVNGCIYHLYVYIYVYIYVPFR